MDYSNYLAENLDDDNIQYGEYLAENLDSSRYAVVNMKKEKLISKIGKIYLDV